MQEYINKNCAQCGEKFTDNDDIAVCPYCGTPVHRSCWNGHCPNEARHAENYDWDKDSSNAEPVINKTGAPLENQTVCSVCKHPINERSVYCPDCGAPMHMKCFIENKGCPNTEHHDGSFYDEENLNAPDGSPKIYIDTFESFADKVVKHPVRDRETGEPITCRGVTQAELVHFLGKDYISTPRYMSLFIRMDKTGKKLAFNIWQGLLMPYYQFYQKMIGPGSILLLLMFILNIPSNFLQLQIEMGLITNGASQSFFSLWAAANSAFAEAMLTSPLAPIINILSYVSLGIQILMALFGDYVYMRWVTGRILSLREKFGSLPEREYYEVLERKGNPRWYFTLLAVGISLLCSYLFTIFAGSVL